MPKDRASQIDGAGAETTADTANPATRGGGSRNGVDVVRMRRGQPVLLEGYRR
jgi:hypothetical protein